MATPETTALTPPYIPWKSFVSYLAGLKNTTIPQTLDNSVRPASMAGGVWRQLTSALQFLGFINASKVVQDVFKATVRAYGSPEWKGAVSSHVLPAYAKIIGDLPLGNATAGQLEKRFRENGKIDGQMLEKCIRFYIHALREADVKYSSYFAMRRKRAISKRAGANKANRKKRDDASADNGHRDQTDKTSSGEQPGENPPAGLIEQRLFFKGKPTGYIRVPADLTEEDCKVIQLTLEVLKAYAAQGGTANN
jgi:hypothetical protein